MRLYQPTAMAPATDQPPGGFPVCTVHGADDGVDVAQRTPAAVCGEPPTWYWW